MKTSSLPKILHICKAYLPVKGGVQRVVQGITTGLPNFFHRVITTGLDGAIRHQKLDGLEVVRCRSYVEIASMPIAPSLVSKVVSQVYKHDLVALHYPFPLAEAALTLVPFTPPIVIHWHSDVIAQKRLKWLVVPLTLLTMLRAKAIVVTSDKMLSHSFLLQLFQKKIRYIPYGIPAIPDQPIDYQSSDHFALIGRHVSYKGIDVAIKAIAQTPYKLIIVGDGPLFEQHEQLVASLNLSKQIQFERHAKDDQVNHLISQSIALIVPSVQENEAFALVQLEAMRLGKPVINTNLQSSVPWVARHQREAITIAPKDASALTEAMRSLADDSVLREKLGNAALLRFNQEFRADIFASRINQLYSSLIQK